MSRRTLAAVLVVLVLAFAAGEPTWAQKPIKIGFMVGLTGLAPQVGKDMVDGFKMYLDEHGNQMAGRKVELIVEDNQGRPEVAVNKLRKFVESDNVDMVVGEAFAHIALALAPKANDYQIPYVIPVAASDDLTQRQRVKWAVRTGWTSSQPSHPFGEWVAKNLKYKRVATIAADYAFGWEVVGGFQRTFEESGGQVVQKLWVPLNVADWAPYLSQIRRDADAVFALAVAAAQLRFPKQYEDAGLKGRLPLIGGAVTFDESALPRMGDEAIGGISPLMYSAALDTLAMREWVKVYKAKFGKVPSYYSETCYTTARWIETAAKAVGGKVEDREAFLTALKKVELPDALRGPIKLDAYGNPLQNIYIRKVEKKNGELQNTVVFTYPAVSQFWKWNPEEYLKQPAYTRDYPPCKYC
ncbi:MAG: ABC transporter substrate-binding protein [Candidatus Rokubacteria bacterium]|nr:ABC transporter substrate-binding protein [Candidatus Rokubacteria bacterium]